MVTRSRSSKNGMTKVPITSYQIETKGTKKRGLLKLCLNKLDSKAMDKIVGKLQQLKGWSKSDVYSDNNKEMIFNNHPSK